MRTPVVSRAACRSTLNSAATQAMVVLYSAIRLFCCLEGQLVRPIADTATEIDLVAAQIVAHLRIGDSFAKTSAAVELELADWERQMCSAAWFAMVVAALIWKEARRLERIGILLVDSGELHEGLRWLEWRRLLHQLLDRLDCWLSKRLQ